MKTEKKFNGNISAFFNRSVSKSIFLAFLLIITNCSINAQVNLKPTKSDNENLWGYINDKGKLVIPYKYNKASVFYGKFAIVEEGYKEYFLINEKGKRINEKPYDIIKYLEEIDNSFLVRKTSESTSEWFFNVINQKGKKIFEKDCNSIDPKDKLLVFSTKANYETTYSYGIANSKGDIIVKPVYKFNPSFYGEIAVVKTIISSVYKFGIIKTTGEFLVPFSYDDAGIVNSNLFWVKTPENKFQFINSAGIKIDNLLVDEYKVTDSNGKALMQIRKGSKWGLSKGYVTIVDCKYDKIEEVIGFRTDKFFIYENNKCGVIDTARNVLVPVKYNSVKNSKNSIFFAYSDNGTHLYKSGKEITVFPKDIEVSDFSYGLAKIKQNGLYGYIDTLGNTIIPCKYNIAADFEKERGWVVLTNEFKGYIDKTGKQVSENEYITDKEKELLAAEKEKAATEDRMKFLDKNFPYQYSDAYCSLRMSTTPAKNTYETLDYGTRKDVISTAIANDVYVIGCMLSYINFNKSNADKLSEKNMSLLDATLKALETGNGITTKTLSDYTFKNLYKGQKYTYFFKDHYFKVVDIQKNNTVFSVTLFGPQPFDDKIFDTYIGTFEIK